MTPAPDRRLSPLRLLVVAGVIAGLVALGWVGWQRADRAVDRIATRTSDTWFAPYADVTLVPSHPFEDAAASPAPTTVLGFVVPDRSEPCTPTWGANYDLDGAAGELDLDRRIARVRQRGGDVVISFGGAVNSELAVACTDPSALAGAYRTVVQRYEASIIDLDIEGAALDDAAATGRRAAAVRVVQREAPADRPLDVWLTLPVTPDGLLPNGLSAVEAMLRAGVELAGVNLMTMNFGGSKPGDLGMGEASIAALRATHAQLADAYRRAGLRPSADELWERLGATPMIGRNDVAGEVFTRDDASALADFADEVDLGRVSVWSANRDQECGAQDGDAWTVLPSCSGVRQEPREFALALAGRLDGSPPQRTGAPDAAAAGGRVGDDPQASPYPVWRPDREYATGEKVVWQRTVYEARWWTRDDAPDAPVEHEWDSPWRIVGPVIPSDARSDDASALARPLRWTDDAVYLRGDRVRHGGYLYEARWRTLADEPELDPERPDASAWTVVGRAVEDLPPVFERSPEWQRDAAYARGDRVSLGAYVYEARLANQAERPKPTPSQPERAAWRVVGTRAGDGTTG